MKRLVIPKKGVLVRHANAKALNEKGEKVRWSAYWMRRYKDGDITVPSLEKEKVATAKLAEEKVKKTAVQSTQQSDK